MDRLRPTEQAIFDVLSDGRLHKRDDLMACLLDPLAERLHLQKHISSLRKKLPTDLIIDAVARDHTIWYRLARRYNGHNDE
jgi:hypothetical protein